MEMVFFFFFSFYCYFYWSLQRMVVCSNAMQSIYIKSSSQSADRSWLLDAAMFSSVNRSS